MVEHRKTMPRTRKQPEKPRSTLTFLKAHLPQILAGLLATGAAGGTAVTYNKVQPQDERAARTEQRMSGLDAGLTRVESHVNAHDRSLQRMDRRTTRIETMLEIQLRRSGVQLPPRTDEE